MPSAPPARLLFLRPDTYGDFVLFEPVLRLIRHAWPQTQVGVLIRDSYLDAAPLLAAEGEIQWLTTTCDPYRHAPGKNRAALDALHETVRAFAPDWLVSACFESTWLEMAVASFVPGARQIRLGDKALDPVAQAALEAELGIDWSTLYPEKIPVEADTSEWEKNLQLTSALLGDEAQRWWPVVRVPASARQRAEGILNDLGLAVGAFAVCCAAGTANVQIKSWPAERYGETLAWLERTHGVRALLLGHESERETLEAVRQSARAGGSEPALWLGRAGEMPVVAGLLQAARFYFGNDTGALHLAAGLERPVVSIFGGGHWPRFKPVARRSAVVVQPLPCFGCGWNCLFGYAPCVREIPSETVQSALVWLLAGDAAEEKEFTVEDALTASSRALIEGAVATQGKHGSGNEAHTRTALADLLKKLAFSETDRAARLEVVKRQGVEIERLQAQVDHWLAEAGRLQDALAIAEAERNLRVAELADLRGHFEAAEADRAAQLKVIETQGGDVSRLQAQVDRWLKEAGRLQDALALAEAERNLRTAELADKTSRFGVLELDHTRRLKVIEAQGAENSQLQAQVDRWLKEAARLQDALAIAEAERNLRAAELADLHKHFATSEADRAARLEVIVKQGDEIQRLQAELQRLQGEARRELDPASEHSTAQQNKG